MNVIERRTCSQLGWPRAGAMTSSPDGPVVPIDFGDGQVIWAGNAAWVRQLITALTAAVHQLEAEGLESRRHPYAEPQVESTAVIDAVPSDPQPEPGDQLVHPAPQEATDVDR